MKKRMIGGCARACLAAAIAGAAWGANAETYATWKGADGAFLNDAANWDGDAPFNGTSANGMQFKATESNAYTVKLSDDLVSAGTWAFEDKPMTMTWDLNGHSMTFMTEYHSHVHQGWTNIFLNGQNRKSCLHHSSPTFLPRSRTTCVSPPADSTPFATSSHSACEFESGLSDDEMINTFFFILISPCTRDYTIFLASCARSAALFLSPPP